MNSLLAILSLVAVASAVPVKLIQVQLQHTQASDYSLKTDHPVNEPAPIIKGVPQPYAVEVPQPYAVPRAVAVEVPRAVPITVTRTVGVPVIARGEPIVRTRVVRTESNDDGLSGLGGLSLGGGRGGYGGEGLISLGANDGGYGDNSGIVLKGLSLGGGYGSDRGYGDNSGLSLKGLSLGSLSLSNGYSKY